MPVRTLKLSSAGHSAVAIAIASVLRHVDISYNGKEGAKAPLDSEVQIPYSLPARAKTVSTFFVARKYLGWFFAGSKAEALPRLWYSYSSESYVPEAFLSSLT